jgi:hypothetical protein
MIWPFRLEPDARTVVQPQPCALRLPLRHFQPLPAPDTLNALLVHPPTRVPKQRRDPSVTVAAILPCQSDDVGRVRVPPELFAEAERIIGRSRKPIAADWCKSKLVGCLGLNFRRE